MVRTCSNRSIDDDRSQVAKDVALGYALAKNTLAPLGTANGGNGVYAMAMNHDVVIPTSA